ncbi:MAG: nitrate/nitrite transporter NrtS [Paracoccaceae bacterium]
MTRQTQPTFLQLATGDGTPRKAFVTALVVGTVLTVINHGDTLLAGAAPPLGKILLTYCVPYCVTTWGAIGAKRAAWNKANQV